MFKILFVFWGAKLGIPPVPIVEDRRYSGHLAAVISNSGKKLFRVVYNKRRLSRWPYEVVVMGVFHEIGHIVQKLPYDTTAEMVESEVQAERYGLKMLGKHYPQFLAEAIKYVKTNLANPRWRAKAPIHCEAYRQIEEYQ